MEIQWVTVEKKLSKYLTQTFMSHGNEMSCQPLTLSGYAASLKVAEAVIEAPLGLEAKGASGLSDDFTPLVRRLMARDQIPGLAVGLVERGRLVFARGFGYRDAYTHLPVTPDTLFAL